MRRKAVYWTEFKPHMRPQDLNFILVSNVSVQLHWFIRLRRLVRLFVCQCTGNDVLSQFQTINERPVYGISVARCQ